MAWQTLGRNAPHRFVAKNGTVASQILELVGHEANPEDIALHRGQDFEGLFISFEAAQEKSFQQLAVDVVFGHFSNSAIQMTLHQIGIVESLLEL
jgi:hypothetical protein